jgi:probable F420-dependent oxidoreductase
VRFGISTFVTDDGIAPGPLAAAIEERGFDSVFIAEYTHIPASRRSPYPAGGKLSDKYYRTLDPFVALTAMAMMTKELLLETGVALLMERDTIITAKEVASLDLVSGGGAIFGVGVGCNRGEIDNHGTDPRTRGRLVDEQLAALREIWTQDPAEYHGEFVNFDPIFSRPKPVQKPHVPIYVGGGKAAFGRVAKFGDAWLANRLLPGKLGPMMDELREVVGRDMPVSVFNASDQPEDLKGYARLGVDRVLLNLPTLPEDESLDYLDTLTRAAAATR